MLVTDGAVGGGGAEEVWSGVEGGLDGVLRGGCGRWGMGSEDSCSFGVVCSTLRNSSHFYVYEQGQPLKCSYASTGQVNRPSKPPGRGNWREAQHHATSLAISPCCSLHPSTTSQYNHPRSPASTCIRYDTMREICSRRLWRPAFLFPHAMPSVMETPAHRAEPSERNAVVFDVRTIAMLLYNNPSSIHEMRVIVVINHSPAETTSPPLHLPSRSHLGRRYAF